MKIYEPDHKTRKKYRYEFREDQNAKIFLAGPFMGTFNWRSEMIDKFIDFGLEDRVSVINPCPEKLKTEFDSLDYQTAFEREGFENADIVVFYIPKADDENDPDYGKTTRFELGQYLNEEYLDKHNMIVSINDSFKGKDYIYRMMNIIGPNVNCTNLYTRETIDEIVSVIANVFVPKPKIWFTSDTHFGQDRTLNLSKRPFKNTVIMNKTICDNINEVVKPYDTLYHLGDWGYFDMREYYDINCKNIVLIRGNYDSDNICDKLMTYYDNIEEVYDNLLIKPEGCCPLFLTHKPTDPLTEEAKECNAFKLFGHIHALQKVKRSGLNVGIDAHNFYPIDLDTVLFYKNAIENHYDEDVFCL